MGQHLPIGIVSRVPDRATLVQQIMRRHRDQEQLPEAAVRMGDEDHPSDEGTLGLLPQKRGEC